MTLNTPLTTMDISSRQKVNKETMALNDTLDQIDLLNIFSTFHPKTTESIFLSRPHGTFSKIGHTWVTKQHSTGRKRLHIFRSQCDET